MGPARAQGGNAKPALGESEPGGVFPSEAVCFRGRWDDLSHRKEIEKHRGPCARVRVPCDSALLKEGRGLAGLGGHWDKTFRAVPCAVHPICEKGVAWYMAETLTGRPRDGSGLACGGILLGRLLKMICVEGGPPRWPSPGRTRLGGIVLDGRKYHATVPTAPVYRS